MKNSSRIISMIVVFVALCSFEQETDPLKFIVPQGWPSPVYDLQKNPLTNSGVALGKKLFFDPVLSRDHTISCASCHLPQTAFTHIDHTLSHGIENRIGTRNSPALMNLAWHKDFMWDGAIHHLDVQALAPISHHDEMDEEIGHVVNKLNGFPVYRKLAYEAFHDSVLTGELLLKSLAQFMLTLVSANAKYDRVKRGEAKFNTYEERGYKLFKANCNSCHTEPLFTHGGFENNGLPVDSFLMDDGRKKVTGKTNDHLKFKVPTLRNVEVSYPYMHDGRFANLQMVLFHYSHGISNSKTLAPVLRKGVNLSEEDKRDLIAFLKTLTDESFLHNVAFR